MKKRARLYTQAATQTDVLSAAMDRVRYLFTRFDRVAVSFSGGKDSTAALAVVSRVARELGRLPLHVVFVDEEVIHPQTIEYVERVRNRPDLDLEWWCLPFKHRNACSNEQPYWYCWNPDERGLWVRDMPSWAVTSHPAFKWGQSYQDFMSYGFDHAKGSTCLVTGVRSQESLRRMRMMLMKRNDNYITARARAGSNTYLAHPIYDWRTEDVWKLVADWGLDYNAVYDVFNHTKLHGRLLAQRICQPFGEEPIRGLAQYAECFPELWAKMTKRVKGVNTAFRYANTELYGIRLEKPEGLSWQEYTQLILEGEEDEAVRAKVWANIQSCIRLHSRKSVLPLMDEETDPVSGCSWKFMAKLAIKRDLKGRTSQGMINLAHQACRKQGLTAEQAIEKWGRK